MSTLIADTVLLSFRLMPITLVAPLAFFRRAPTLVRFILTLSLAWIIAGSIGVDSTRATTLSIGAFVTEFFIGAMLVFSFHCATAALQTMGRMIDQQIGFAAANILDPHNDSMEGLTGEILTLCLLITFVTLDFHYALLEAFRAYAIAVPPASFPSVSFAYFTHLGAQFAYGFALVTPIFVSLWLIDVALAFVSRSLPQANIYFVGLPLKIGIGIIVAAFSVKTFGPTLINMLLHSLEHWSQLGV